MSLSEIKEDTSAPSDPEEVKEGTVYSHSQTEGEESIPESTRRKRVLTEKGKELFYANKRERCSKLEKVRKTLENIPLIIKQSSDNLKQLRQCEKDLHRTFQTYRELSEDYIAFLSRSTIEESSTQADLHKEVAKCLKMFVKKVASDLDKQIQELIDKGSHRSSSKDSQSCSRSTSTGTSRLTIMIAKKQAKAESARVAFEYAKKQSQLLKKQALTEAEMQAERTLLEHEKKTALAEAEVRALQSASGSHEGSLHSKSSIKVPYEDPKERTKAYVSQLSHAGVVNSNLPNDNFPCEDKEQIETGKVKHGSTLKNINTSSLDPYAQPYYPAMEITRFLLKKDLLLSRLRTFNDQPEAYAIWKAGFRSVMQEMQVTSEEELDLLVKWLGQESSRHAMSLRAANVNDPDRGLQQIWERLDERYGCPEMVEAALKARLSNFPKLTNRDHKKLYELSDLLSEIESVKSDDKYRTLLAYFDSSSGVNPIVNKLPYNLQDKWSTNAFKYKERHGVSFPPFSEFVKFVRDASKMRNDPSFAYDANNNTLLKRDKPTSATANSRPAVQAKKTDVSPKTKAEVSDLKMRCLLHNTGHTLNNCIAFKAKPYEERKDFLKKRGVCYKCCLDKHLAKSCTENVRCADCGSSRHPTALHFNTVSEPLPSPRVAATVEVGMEKSGKDESDIPVSSKCTQICGKTFQGKSCAKTVLVKVHPKGQPEKSVTLYAILDDQSNSSLARSDFFDLMNIQSERIPYTLSSCAGLVKTSGRRAGDFIVESLDGTFSLELPILVECNEIPDVREEIATPEVALYHSHLVDIADQIPPLNDSARILLLIGRDMIEAHHVHDQRIGPGRGPFAQKLCFGWVIIGEVCLGKVHRPDKLNVNKTYLFDNGRTSIFKPCPNKIKLSVDLLDESKHGNFFLDELPQVGSSIFHVSKDDDKPGLSVEDIQFLQIMDEGMFKGPEGNWVAPLPFRTPRPTLPNNRAQAVKRAKTLGRSMCKDPVKQKHMTEFMKRILDAKHAEVAPPLSEGEEVWYLPLFGVRHPKKPNQIRGVFDASALFNGVSLNNVLLQGPDLTNNLLGILLRFRREPVAVMGDIEQMFHCFHVHSDHRNFLRFMWYEDNDPSKDLIEYRMKVHVFGNRPSPAVATYGLRKTAETGKEEFGEDMKEFVDKDFYVDDGLASLPNATDAIDLIKCTQQALKIHGNMRFHKISSNSQEVMEAFPSEDRASDLKNLSFDEDNFPLQRSLGISWDIKSDMFTFQVSTEDKPFTKRGILSTVNSIYDPMGFLAPVTIKGKQILRSLTVNVGWDDLLPPECQKEWEEWRDSLRQLEQLHIPRAFVSSSFQGAQEKQIFVYSDASEKAIAAVAYLVIVSSYGETQGGFIMGKAKVAPSHGHTIPRLELCAAVLAVEISDAVCECLNIPSHAVFYHTDSKIVLGYVRNQSKRFNVYICNRVARIRKSSTPQQWRYISTEANPADHGTRSVPAGLIAQSPWLTGPSQLVHLTNGSEEEENQVDIEMEDELLPSVTVQTTHVKKLDGVFGSHHFEKFSSWKSLVNGVAFLKHFVRNIGSQKKLQEVNVSTYLQSENFIIKQIQMEHFGKEIQCIQTRHPLSKNSSLLPLDPFLDVIGMLRVGGRLNKTDMDLACKNPLIIPGQDHVATLLVRHYHERVQHQGRHFTEGAIRAAGLWIIRGKRLVSSLIHKCVKCRKLRGKAEQLKMSDLPQERLNPSPPFTYVGVDAFGPWSVVARRTRGGHACHKRWAILFTCLVCRAIHIEVVEDMSTSAFINSLRRFIALRGDVKQFRSDRGTNFVGCTEDLNIKAVNVEDSKVKQFLCDNRTEWIFNPPQASHMGGVWERMIGVCRRILDSMLNDTSARGLTHEVLTTFMAEVCAIVNGRPIIPVSTDPESPSVLTPSTLLTQKTDPVSSIGDMNQDFDLKDLYRSQWKRVQALADTFWHRWHRDYLQNLQYRRKWHQDGHKIQPGDVVLLKEKTTHRNQWPMGIVVTAIQSDDGRVRKATVRISREGKTVVYTRPATEMVVLLPNKD